MHLYLVRHGLARHNLEDPDSCPYDPAFEAVEKYDHSLTPQGERQADLTGRRLAGVDFDCVLVSPFHRTLSTCAGILRHQKRHLPMEVYYPLVECTAAHFRMMPSELVARVWDDVRLICENDLPDDTPHNLWLRAKRTAEYLKGRFRGEEKVLVVSHGAFLSQYLIAACMGMEEHQADKYLLCSENCAITKLHIRDGKKTLVVAIDETGHLGSEISQDPFGM